MPWQQTQMNEVRKEFGMKALEAGQSFAALCREYGVSRKTGYKWKLRAMDDGLKGLREHSRRPRSSPKQLDE
ncbi:MAG: helix-turn-helix domain-containing protein, partial [Opitutaceae bacterium]